MKTYLVRIHYTRPSGTQTSVDYTIEAKSVGRANHLAKRNLEHSAHRRCATIDNIETVEKQTPSFLTGVAHASAAPVQKVLPVIRAGDTVTLDIPFTGVVEHNGIDKVTIVGPVVGPHGQRAKRTFPREYFEQLIGAPLEAPTKTTFVSIYPRDEKYSEAYPVKSSQYGVENLVQVKITRTLDGKLVSKEFV